MGTLSKYIKENRDDLILGLAVFLITIISFNIGRIYNTGSSKNSISITGSKETITNNNVANIPTPILDLRVVASKNSNKYHYLWCSGAKMIKESNKIYFNSSSEAENGGYTLAGNCYK